MIHQIRVYRREYIPPPVAPVLLVILLSAQNLNVYYELGLAHGLRKKVILLTRCMDVIPFDIKHENMLIYHDINQLKEELAKVLRALSGN